MKKSHLANATKWDIDDPMDREVLEAWVRHGDVEVFEKILEPKYAAINVTPATREWAKEAVLMAAIAKAAQ